MKLEKKGRVEGEGIESAENKREKRKKKNGKKVFKKVTSD